MAVAIRFIGAAVVRMAFIQAIEEFFHPAFFVGGHFGGGVGAGLGAVGIVAVGVGWDFEVVGDDGLAVGGFEVGVGEVDGGGLEAVEGESGDAGVERAAKDGADDGAD